MNLQSGIFNNYDRLSKLDFLIIHHYNEYKVIMGVWLFEIDDNRNENKLMKMKIIFAARL